MTNAMVTQTMTRALDRIAQVRLTRREKQVLGLAARGFTAQQIGDELHVSVRTINFHTANILEKTETTNVTAAVAVALHQRLIPAPTSVVPRTTR